MRLILTVNFSPWSPYSGGAQRSTHNLASALSRRGHAVTVVYTKARGERIEPDVPVPYDVEWAAFAGRRSRREAPLRPLNAITVAAAVARLLRRGDVDAVHGNGEEAALVGDIPRRRFAFVMTPRFPEYPPSMLRPGGPSTLQRVGLGLLHAKYLVLGRALRAADWVVATSGSARTMVERAYAIDPARLRVVPNGIDEAFLAGPRQGMVKGDAVVFFGRLSRGKGVDTLLDALALMGPDAPRCIVVGRGELAERVRAAGERVELRDWMAPAGLAELLASARLVVLPSREESFGNAIAESMAVGAAVIATHVGSVPELVDDGHSGVLVAPGDAESLAAAMRRLLDDRARAEAMGAAARASLGDRYRWDCVAAAFEDCYRARPR